MPTPKLSLVPNVGSRDLIETLTPPCAWERTRALIDELGLYDHHVLATPADAATRKVGKNRVELLKAADVFATLQRWGLHLTIEAPAVKAWDRSGEKSSAQLTTVIDTVRLAGGHVSLVNFDEPLASSIEGQHDRSDVHSRTHYPYTEHQVRDVARITARCCNTARAMGSRPAISEAWPQHPMARIVPFVQHVEDFGGGVKRVVLNIDPSAEMTGRGDPHQLERWCRSKRIEFAVILTGHRIQPGQKAASHYCRKALAMLDLIEKLKLTPDRLVLQSWQECGGEKWVPDNLPETGTDSHLSLVRRVAAAVSRRTR